MSLTSNIVFFGTPQLAVSSLDAILQSGRQVSLVVSQPDRPVGRGQRLAPTPIKIFAQSKGLNVIQPKKMKDPTLWAQLEKTHSKLFVVAAYGRILPAGLLDVPEMTINVHASLLPRWRGAAPIARTIQAGDKVTGISIMKIVAELDAGDFCLQKSLDVHPEETTKELTERLSVLGGEAVVEALELIEKGKACFVAQDKRLVTFAPPIEKKEATVNWANPAETIHNQVRAFNPWPGADTTDGIQRIKLHRTRLCGISTDGAPAGTLKATKEQLWVAAANEWLEIIELQREGRIRQPAKSFLQGYPIREGTLWG